MFFCGYDRFNHFYGYLIKILSCLDPSSVSSADYSRVEISKQLIDPLAGAHAYSVVLNKDFVLQAPSHETLPSKPLVINTSSVNFPKSEVGY